LTFTESGAYPRATGYGCQWWRALFEAEGHLFEATHTLGYGGQVIVIFENLNMVVVMTGGGDGRNSRDGLKYINDYILPAFLPVFQR